jgi:hypothetical protein
VPSSREFIGCTIACGSKPMSIWRNSRCQPLNTDITNTSTPTPSMTPSIEITVMTEMNERVGRRVAQGEEEGSGVQEGEGMTNAE